MLDPRIHDPHEGAPVPRRAAVALRDDLLAATRDLDRLQGLLAHACDRLMHGFHGAADDVQALVEAARDTPSQQRFESVVQHLEGAITALQFQDMASQLIAHTHQRLRDCTDRLAREQRRNDDGDALSEAAPSRPHPVTQAEMGAGAVELF